MRRPIGFLAIVALLAGASGCASTALREDGSPILGPRAWSTPPAPPQQVVKLTADTKSLPTDHPSLRQRLAGSLTIFSKKPAEPPHALGTPDNSPAQPPALASATSRPTWFGLRPQKPAPTSYMTDARGQLDRPAPTPTMLPVALQVPSPSATADEMVRPTSGPGKSPTPVTQGVVIGEGAAPVPDLGGKPSASGEDEVNPLPPAAEPGTAAALLNRMATPVDAKPAKPAGSQADDRDESTILVAKVPDDPKAEAAPTPPAPPTTPPASSPEEAPQPMIPTASRQSVLASPQSPPPMPTAQMKPSPQAKPSPQVKPSPQGAATETKWRRPCLRRLVRRVWHLGEFADPPTAAPH